MKRFGIKISAFIIAAMLMITLTGCSEALSGSKNETSDQTVTEEAQDGEVSVKESKDSKESDSDEASSGSGSESGSLLDTSDLFTNRDMEQEPDLSAAETVTLTSGEDVTITDEGIYIITGTAEDTTIIVDADSAKVQLVLDGVSITNEDFACIYVKDADKVFVTTTDSENTLEVTGEFVPDDDENVDAVIYSKDDITINGIGTLNIKSTDNGISGHDDLTITGGEINITATKNAVEAHDSIEIAGGTLNITSSKNGLKCKDNDDDSKGYIYISGGTFNITASNDGIHGTTEIIIDGGTFDITAYEAIEGTAITINDGDITISASDDGINASRKSSLYSPVVNINGGNLVITMGQGDTDALDSNGDLYINGGTIDITAQSPFDYDGTGAINGGTVTVNGEEVTEIYNQFMGGENGQMGGMPGGGFGGPGGEGEGFERPDGSEMDGEMPSPGEEGQEGDFQRGPGGRRPDMRP